MERRMRTMAYGMAVVLVSAAAASAQTAAPGDARGAAVPSAAHLHLSAEGMVSEPPDVLVGDLTTEATSPSAVGAQRKVNEMMAQGMKDARAIDGIEARALGYSVNQIDLDEALVPVRPHARRMGWTAQQTLEVRGKDGERLLALVGKLQDQGLAVSSLDWQLSPELARQARDAAMVNALRALRVRADKAAQALDLRVVQLQDVRVNMQGSSPIRPMLGAQMKAMVAPQATATPQDITSEVTADVLLAH
jgi:uncharacterized protein YggE